MSARTITITSVSQIRKGDRVVSEGDYHIPTMGSPWTVERSAPEVEPGTVGTATVRGVEGVQVVRTSRTVANNRDVAWFTPIEEQIGGWWHREDEVTSFVPDPDTAALRAEVERLTRELAGIGCSRFTCADDLTRLRAEVERLQGELYSERNAVETMVGLRKGVADWAAMQKARADAAEARLARVRGAWGEYRRNLGGSIPEHYRDQMDAALVAADEQAAEGEGPVRQVTRARICDVICPDGLVSPDDQAKVDELFALLNGGQS